MPLALIWMKQWNTWWFNDINLGDIMVEKCLTLRYVYKKDDVHRNKNCDNRKIHSQVYLQLPKQSSKNELQRNAVEKWHSMETNLGLIPIVAPVARRYLGVFNKPTTNYWDVCQAWTKFSYTTSQQDRKGLHALTIDQQTSCQIHQETRLITYSGWLYQQTMQFIRVCPVRA
jgi:hypothetical protein